MTLEQIQALTDDEIRVRVAELTGDFKNCRIIKGQHGDWDDVVGFGTYDDGTLADSEDTVPNYPADLNACHEFERMLSTREASEYNRALQGICLCAEDTGPASDYGWHAPGRTRCEALLAVMQP